MEGMKRSRGCDGGDGSPEEKAATLNDEDGRRVWCSGAPPLEARRARALQGTAYRYIFQIWNSQTDVTTLFIISACIRQ